MTENKCFGPVFAKTRSINTGTEEWTYHVCSSQPVIFYYRICCLEVSDLQQPVLPVDVYAVLDIDMYVQQQIVLSLIVCSSVAF